MNPLLLLVSAIGCLVLGVICIYGLNKDVLARNVSYVWLDIIFGIVGLCGFGIALYAVIGGVH